MVQNTILLNLLTEILDTQCIPTSLERLVFAVARRRCLDHTKKLQNKVERKHLYSLKQNIYI